MTSARAPTSYIDGAFSSELEGCTPQTRKSRMTALSMKHPPQVGKQVPKVNHDVLSQKRTEMDIQVPP